MQGACVPVSGRSGGQRLAAAGGGGGARRCPAGTARPGCLRAPHLKPLPAPCALQCTNPGCNLGTVNQGTDCVHCWPQQGSCVNNQWCRAPCAWGFFWRSQQCYPCSQTIANCANCVACSMGKVRGELLRLC